MTFDEWRVRSGWQGLTDGDERIMRSAWDASRMAAAFLIGELSTHDCYYQGGIGTTDCGCLSCRASMWTLDHERDVKSDT